MAFTLPIFNKVADLYYVGNAPGGFVPDMVNLPVQVYFNPRNQGQILAPMLRFEKTALDARTQPIDDGTCVQVWNTSHTAFAQYWLQGPCLIHSGFPNAYYMAEAYPIANDGVTFTFVRMFDFDL